MAECLGTTADGKRTGRSESVAGNDAQSAPRQAAESPRCCRRTTHKRTPRPPYVPPHGADTRTRVLIGGPDAGERTYYRNAAAEGRCPVGPLTRGREGASRAAVPPDREAPDRETPDRRPGNTL
ncbi:hypothetical protein SCWH03_49640 [Streptomyces pacificus]|uniref:Uncharacterized protein n=1 Tax=Streptomyces pacificus TaxID=2705029 RepID=A0A6A0B0R7_9ACTN|nr:hypothetical protein SCWH03_49640 [Streptomyces pacificus]